MPVATTQIRSRRLPDLLCRDPVAQRALPNFKFLRLRPTVLTVSSSSFNHNRKLKSSLALRSHSLSNLSETHKRPNAYGWLGRLFALFISGGTHSPGNLAPQLICKFLLGYSFDCAAMSGREVIDSRNCEALESVSLDASFAYARRDLANCNVLVCDFA